MLNFPFARGILGGKYVFERNLTPAYGGIKVPITDWLSLLAIGGYIPQTDAGIGRGIVDLKIDDQLSFNIDSFNIANRRGLVFSDLTAGLKLKF